jgi:hypothetical protein
MPSPETAQKIGDIINGPMVLRCLLAVADTGVADALGETAEAPEALAKKVDVNADVLGRVLRLLSTHGIFERVSNGYRHTEISRLMRKGHPMGLRELVRLFRTAWPLLGALDYSLNTGRAAAEKIMPSGFWKYLAENPEEGRIFDEGMIGKASADIGSLIAAYDFSQFGSIADIGGGKGHFIRALLAANPKMRGALFDLPRTIDELSADDARLTLRGGDFFKDDMPVCDAYFMMNVLHDWGDAESIAILKNLRRQARPAMKLLVAEMIIPDEITGPSTAIRNDIIMLVYAAGRERTLGEYEALFNTSGWKLARVVTGQSGMSVMEVSPA